MVSSDEDKEPSARISVPKAVRDQIETYSDKGLQKALNSLTMAILANQERRAIFWTGDIYLRTSLNKEGAIKADYHPNGLQALWTLLSKLCQANIDSSDDHPSSSASSSTVSNNKDNLENLLATITALEELFTDTPNKLFIMHAVILTLRVMNATST